MIYSFFGLFGGYVLKAKPGLMCLSFFMPNFVAYLMEMSFIITGSFDQHAGQFDIGPVELELIISSLIFYTGLKGYDGIEESLNKSLTGSVAAYVPDYILW